MPKKDYSAQTRRIIYDAVDDGYAVCIINKSHPAATCNEAFL